jgi:hypothetical protein
MAKRKSTKPAKAESKNRGKSPAEKPEDGQGLEPELRAARTPGSFSGIEIGHVAGDVWGLLGRDGELTIAAIKKAIGAPDDVVSAAIGWLAREDKLEFSTRGRNVKISLRQ